jgi:hypothetical protein
MCVFAYFLRIQAIGVQKNHQKIQKTPSDKNVPQCSFAYLCNICFQGKEITT